MKKIILLGTLFSGLLVWGQSFTASVRGVVTDASHSTVPNAKITVTDVQRNLNHAAVSDNSGRYVITSLPPGTYALTAQAAGFKKFSRNAFELQVQQEATVNVELQVGEVATTVEISSSAPLINTTSADLGTVVSNSSIQSLPLAGRAPLALVALTAGINPVNTSAGGQSSTNFVANGVRNSTSDVLLDGMSLTNVEQNSGITNLEYQPSVDVVQEFKVQTNFFSAEFGNTGGAVVNMITKSGTNAFHGVGYEFARNAAMNANSWFSNRAGRSIPDFKRNVFGATIGGPVLIPKVYDGHNKTFFFGDFEGTRQSNADTRLSSIPSLLERQGNFSETRAASGALITIYNPFDTYKTADGRTLRRLFEGNMVPLSMQHKIAQNALSYYPKPTSEGNAFTHTNNFFGQGVSESAANQMDAKLDHNINDRQRFTSRYSLNSGHSTPPNFFGNMADPYSNGDSMSRTHNFVFNFTRLQSATTILELRYGVLRQHAVTLPKSDGFNPTSLGLSSIYLTSGLLQFPAFQSEGYQQVGMVGYGRIARGDDVQSITGNVTKIFSGHILKVGAEARLMRLNYLQPGFPQGNFNFNRAVTNQDPNSNNSLQGNAIASMLLGWGSGGNYHLDPPSASASKYFGFYGQDDWKITPKLTINLGLRFDFDVPRTERYNRLSWFDFNAPSPIAGKVPGYSNLKGQFKFADANTRSPIDGDYNNWQPRIGFAYALGNKTALRGGYGIYYTVSRATIKGHTGSGFSTDSGPEFSRDGGLTQYATLENSYPNGLNIPPGNSLGPATFLGLGIGTETRPDSNPQYQSWNFSVQRQIPLGSVVEVNYTGSKGNHLYFGGGVENQNRLDPSLWSMGRTALNALVPNPFYGIITNTQSRLSQPSVTLNTLLRPFPQYAGGVSGSTPNIGNSVYHAVQFKYEKRLSHGFSVQGHYTISKLIDDSSFSAGNVSWLGGTTSVQNYKNLRLERSVSAMDVPQRLVMSFAYEVPVGKGKAIGAGMGKVPNAILGGWSIDGLMTFSRGFPLIPGLQGGVLWEGSQRPNLLGDPSVAGSVESRMNNYFNTAAFSRPAPDTFGTAPRTLNYRAPGLKNADMSLLKSVRFTEARSLQFRLEAFNLTNSPTFGAPDASFGSSTFGVISGYAGGTGPRQLQVAVKFYY
jgi:hypothetical protein